MELPPPDMSHRIAVDDCNEESSYSPELVREIVAAKVTAERERCAKVCRDKAHELLDRAHAGRIAEDTKRHALIKSLIHQCKKHT